MYNFKLNYYSTFFYKPLIEAEIEVTSTKKMQIFQHNSNLIFRYYSIVAPGTIRPNSEYHVAVSVHKNSEPSSIKVGIISATYSNFQTVDLRPYSTKLIRFEVSYMHFI